MKIKILKSTVCEGKSVSAGDVVDPSEKNARLLINLGKAEAYTAPQAKKKVSKKKLFKRDAD